MKEAPTTLYEAIARRDFPSIRHLIGNKKVDPSFFPDNPTTTPIIEAVKIKCPYMILLFQSYGADLARTDNNGRSALHHAILRNDIVSCIFLVNRNCPMNERDNFGFTPLVLAIQRNNMEIVRFLVKSGAVIYPEKGPLHSMPLVTAAYFGVLDIMNFLLSVPGTDLKKKDMHMNYALCMASYTDRADLLQFLINKGASISRWNPGDQSPLEFAVMADNQDIISLLLSSGASIHDRDHLGYTPLMHAAISNSPSAASLLISYGADPKETANDMRTSTNTIVEKLHSRAVAHILFLWNYEVFPALIYND